MVRQGAHTGQGRALLPAALGPSRDEEAGVFTPVATGGPLLTGGIPEGLPLGRKVAVAGGDAEEEGVIALESVGGDGGDVEFWGGVHLGEDFGREGLRDSSGRGNFSWYFFHSVRGASRQK